MAEFNGRAKESNEEEERFSIRGWELFHTDAQVKGRDDRVDQVSIDRFNKRYVLDINISDMSIDGWDDYYEPIDSLDVSRAVFDIIVEGLRLNGYVRFGEKENVFNNKEV